MIGRKDIRHNLTILRWRHLCSIPIYLPFSVLFIGIKIDIIHGITEVHLSCVVAPGPEDQIASLLVKWIVRDVDLADSFEDSTRFPMYAP